jgi:hypothetical protein
MFESLNSIRRGGGVACLRGAAVGRRQTAIADDVIQAHGGRHRVRRKPAQASKQSHEFIELDLSSKSPPRAHGEFSAERARGIGERIGIDWSSSRFDVEQFLMGLDVELEHVWPKWSRKPSGTGSSTATTDLSSGLLLSLSVVVEKCSVRGPRRKVWNERDRRHYPSGRRAGEREPAPGSARRRSGQRAGLMRRQKRATKVDEMAEHGQAVTASHMTKLALCRKRRGTVRGRSGPRSEGERRSQTPRASMPRRPAR